jgi:hypothetical protein
MKNRFTRLNALGLNSSAVAPRSQTDVFEWHCRTVKSQHIEQYDDYWIVQASDSEHGDDLGC